MKKHYLIILSLLLLSFVGISQNSNLPKDHELVKLKKERFNNINKLTEPAYYNGNSATRDIKSVQNDFGNPPEWDWVTTFGGSGEDITREIVVAPDGSFYITGSFSGEISIGPNSYTSIGRIDAFLAKFQSDGSFVWLNQFSPLPGEHVATYGLHLDDLENVYFTGYYTGDVSFGDVNLPGLHGKNLFLAVANSDGEITMAVPHATINPEELGIKVDTDSDGNIYVLGSTDGSTNYRHPSVIIKYTFDGTVLLEYYNDQNFCDLKIVGDQIYTCGTVIEADYIGDFYLDPTGYNDAFMAKSNTSFEFDWVEMGNHNAPYSGDSYAIALHVSLDEDIFLLGYFRSELIWGSTVLDGISGFVTGCSSDGNILWATETNYYGQDTPTAITGNGADVFVSTTNNNTGEIQIFNAVNGELILEADTDYFVESLCFSVTDNSLIISQDANQVILLSKLDDNSLTTEWNTFFGGNSAWAHGIGMDVDQFGLMFNFGYASNQMDYFGQTINRGLYLTRQNAMGVPFWIVQFANADDISNYIGNHIVVDTNTNSVYITGMFSNPLVIPGGPTLTPYYNKSIFLIKYDFDGNYQWSLQKDFVSLSNNLSLATDNSGNVFLSGTFAGSVSFGNTDLVSAGHDDVFVAKYDSNGDLAWAVRAGGEDLEWDCLISTDDDNNVYLTGEFDSHDVTVDDYSITMEDGDGNILIAKFDPLGNVLWAKAKGGSSVSPYADYYGWPTGIFTDADGNSYIKGWCNDSTHFDNILLTSSFNDPNYDNRWNKFVAKLDTDGNTIWATSISELTNSSDYNQFDVDKNGNVYTGLRVRNTTMFGDDFIYSYTGLYDLLVINYSNDGELNWVKSIEDSESGSTWISSIVALEDENAYVCGWFTDYLDFGSTEFVVNNKTGFIGLLGELTGIPVYERNGKALLFDLFPNPAQFEVNILFMDDITKESYLVITDIAGREIHSQQVGEQSSKITIDISNFNSGVYFVKLRFGSVTGVKKLVVN